MQNLQNLQFEITSNYEEAKEEYINALIKAYKQYRKDRDNNKLSIKVSSAYSAMLLKIGNWQIAEMIQHFARIALTEALQ